MPLTVTGSLSAPGAFAAAIERDGRRSVARKLNQAGKDAVNIGVQLANSDLGPSRVGNRRRDRGVSFRNGFQVFYSGLEDFGHGDMFIQVKNRSRHARVLEVGSSGGNIPVGEKGVLAWPKPFHRPGPIAVLLRRDVDHPGFTGKRILQRTAIAAMRQSFVGQSVGHARIRVTVGRFR